MKPQVNETHDPKLKSWVSSANDSGSDFPIQNLPFGVFIRPGLDSGARIGVAIGDQILDLYACVEDGLLGDLSNSMRIALQMECLNGVMSLGAAQASALRMFCSRLLRADNPGLASDSNRRAKVMLPIADAELLLPVEISNYSDFYASIHHAQFVGALFRPETPLLPNYKHVPIAYHGRASSIVVSGTQVRRPFGQIKSEQESAPRFAPSAAMDYELELGAFVGSGNSLGSPIPINRAADHIFGYCLLNDWSARDIQKWEYQPLGPFLGKSFATSISSWVVSSEALAPFRCAPEERSEQDPALLSYLKDPEDLAHGAIDIEFEVHITSAKMRKQGVSPLKLSAQNFRQMYWTPAQWLAHHTSNGCNLLPGDLLGSGTISGPGANQRGCLLELTQAGKKPIRLSADESRAFLENGDEVTLTASASKSGYVRIGFGSCTAQIVAAE